MTKEQILSTVEDFISVIGRSELYSMDKFIKYAREVSFVIDDIYEHERCICAYSADTSEVMLFAMNSNEVIEIGDIITYDEINEFVYEYFTNN